MVPITHTVPYTIHKAQAQGRCSNAPQPESNGPQGFETEIPNIHIPFCSPPQTQQTRTLQELVPTSRALPTVVPPEKTKQKTREVADTKAHAVNTEVWQGFLKLSKPQLCVPQH